MIGHYREVSRVQQVNGRDREVCRLQQEELVVIERCVGCSKRSWSL